MTRGRKPKATALKELAGNPGKRARNKLEPRPPVEMPICPSNLNIAARARWNEVCPELMRMGVLARIDGGSLAQYCQAWARWVEAEKQLEKFGPVIKSPSGYPVQNPHLAIANGAMAFCQRFAAEFGMTPSARTRLQVIGDDLPSDPLERLLALKAQRTVGAKR